MSDQDIGCDLRRLIQDLWQGERVQESVWVTSWGLPLLSSVSLSWLFYFIVSSQAAAVEVGGGYSSAVPLSVSEYLKNANSLRGNVYHVTGTIEERLKWTPDRGRLVSLDVENGATFSPVPVLIPQEFSHVNIDRGATMGFIVKVGRDGLLAAESVDGN